MTKLSKITGIGPDVRSFKEGTLLNFTNLYGVEIEIEGMGGFEPPDALLDFWEVKPDGSLRNNGLEFVMRRPLTGSDLEKALADADLVLEKANPSLSRRTSVHVHMDVSGLSVQELVTLVVYYTMFEKLLFRYVGYDRENNVYCIPFWKGTDHFSGLTRAINLIGMSKELTNTRKQSIRAILRSHNKYSALNLAPIVTQGSIEFRHHPGEYRYTRLTQWILLLNKLKEAAVKAPLQQGEWYTPLVHMSDIGPEAMVEEFFGELAPLLITDSTQADLYTGVRTAQEFIFSNRVAQGTAALARWLRDKFPKEHTDTKEEWRVEFAGTAGDVIIDDDIDGDTVRITNTIRVMPPRLRRGRLFRE